MCVSFYLLPPAMRLDTTGAMMTVVISEAVNRQGSMSVPTRIAASSLSGSNRKNADKTHASALKAQLVGVAWSCRLQGCSMSWD